MTSNKLLILFHFFFLSLFGNPDAQLLPSWNEGPAKQAIIQFIQALTQEGSASFIPEEERVATFDEDGTLWVEQPLYVELLFALDAIQRQALWHPEWKEQAPFKSLLTRNQEALKDLSKQEIEQLIAKTHAGMSVEDFHKEVSSWLDRAIHPRFKRPFTELVYQPMRELMQLLRELGFKVYIVSGGGQEFMRAFAKKVYGLSPEYVIGTAGKVHYSYDKGRPVLLKLPQLLFMNDKEGKPEGINLVIGKRPVAAFGNSVGDQQMLEWTQVGPRKSLELLVHHDDGEREYAYGPDSKIGNFPPALMEEAKRHGWLVVSMKNDWKVIFSWQKNLLDKRIEDAKTH